VPVSRASNASSSSPSASESQTALHPDAEIPDELRDMAEDDADIIIRKSLGLGADIVLRRDDV
jgi:hypothetical protein